MRGPFCQLALNIKMLHHSPLQCSTFSSFKKESNADNTQHFFLAAYQLYSYLQQTRILINNNFYYCVRCDPTGFSSGTIIIK